MRDGECQYGTHPLVRVAGRHCVESHRYEWIIGGFFAQRFEQAIALEVISNCIEYHDVVRESVTVQALGFFMRQWR